MKIFQNKIFISFLIISVVFVFSVKVTQAGPAIGFFLGWALNITIGVQIIGDAIFIASLFCVAGGPIGDCSEDGVGVFIVAPSQEVGCAFVQEMTFYNTLPHDIENDDVRQIAIYRFTKPSSLTSDDLTSWLTQFDGASIARGDLSVIMGDGIIVGVGYSGGGFEPFIFTPLRDLNYSTDNTPSPLNTVNYSDICDENDVCKFNDILPENSYIVYAAKVVDSYDLLGTAWTWDITGWTIGMWNGYWIGWASGGRDVSINSPANNKFLSSRNGEHPWAPFAYGSPGAPNVVPSVFNGPYKTGSLSECEEVEGDLASVAITGVSCNSITLSIQPLSADVTEYDVYRDGTLIADSVPISQTIYEDTGLTEGTTYAYTVTVRASSGAYQDFGPIDGTTKCLAVCSFSASPDTLIYPDTDSTLSWSCQNAVSCLISEEIGDVDPDSGTVPVTVDKTTLFVLTCENADGDQTFSTATISVSRPTIIEIPPR